MTRRKDNNSADQNNEERARLAVRRFLQANPLSVDAAVERQRQKRLQGDVVPLRKEARQIA